MSENRTTEFHQVKADVDTISRAINLLDHLTLHRTEALAAQQALTRLHEAINDLSGELRVLNEGAAHNASIDRDEIAFWKGRANGR